MKVRGKLAGIIYHLQAYGMKRFRMRLIGLTRRLCIPPIPERDGYAFDGWYKESECVNIWDFETDALPQARVDDQGQEIYQETKLYAKWIKN